MGARARARDRGRVRAEPPRAARAGAGRPRARALGPGAPGDRGVLLMSRRLDGGSQGMNVRVLDEHDVRRLLPMGECIDVMEAALASLARGELHNPLRFVVRPPGESSLLGLMPAHRSAPSPLYSLKTVAIFPENSARGLDPHQGFVALFDGTTGETRAIMSASAITAVRTAAVSGVATRALARKCARTLAILGAGFQ